MTNANSRWVGQHTVGTPERFTTVCGWCNVAAALERISPDVEHYVFNSGPRGQRTFRLSAAYVCPRSECHQASLLLFLWDDSRAAGAFRDPELAGQLPRGTAQKMDGLPEPIEDVRLEAWSCHYGGDNRAALVMARAAVQRAARTLGATGNNIYEEINDLRAKGLVTEELKEWGHEVRLAARDAAHPEELGDVTPDEAKDSLAFMDDFLRFAIALPELRKARAASASHTTQTT